MMKYKEMLVRDIKDLIKQATEEKSHYYVKSALMRSLDMIKALSWEVEEWEKLAKEWERDYDILKQKYEP